MGISLVLLLVAYLVLIIINKVFRKHVVDAFFLVMSPYVFIIAINNVYMEKSGFFPISDKIIYVHLYAMIIFYIGTILSRYITKAVRAKSFFKRTSFDNMRYGTMIFVAVMLIVFISAGKLQLIRRYGLMGVIKAGDSIKMESIFSHMEFWLYCITIILFDDYLERREKKEIILVALGAVLFFSSFVKYHVISLFISAYIFVVLRKRKYTLKLGVVLALFVVGAFVGNYIVNFITNGIVVNNQFYMNHLWGYIGGSTIAIENVGMVMNPYGENYSILKWLWQMITSLPSMFTNKLFGFPISDYTFSTTLPTMSIGASVTNVISILGSAYLQGNFFSFTFFMLGWGMLVQSVYVKAVNANRDNVRTMLVGSIFLAFNILSFFSSFFVLSAPWETMVWAALLPALLGIRFRLGVNRDKSREVT